MNICNNNTKHKIIVKKSELHQ